MRRRSSVTVSNIFTIYLQKSLLLLIILVILLIEINFMFLSIGYLYLTLTKSLSHLHSHSPYFLWFFSFSLCVLSNPKSVKNGFFSTKKKSQDPSNQINILGSSSTSNKEKYVEPIITLLTPIDSLEVHCELLVDFESMKENGHDLTLDVEFQNI